MTTPTTTTINDKLIEKLESAIAAALEYEAATRGKRNLGITGAVGELLACYAVNLSLVLDARSKGFDAVDKYGKQVQIKTRRSESGGLPSDVGRISRFSKHRFDYALLCLLDHKYRLYEVWHANYKELKPIIEKEQDERRGPMIKSFKRVGKKIKIFSPNYVSNTHTLRGSVIRIWQEDSKPFWDADHTVEICEIVDEHFRSQGLTPAPRFREERASNNRSYIKQWVSGCRFPWL